jgi:transposase
MDYFAAIGVSLDVSSVCVVDATGRIVREAKVASEPEALAKFFGELGLAIVRIGLEAGPLSQWLHRGLVAAGLPAILIETRHVKAALSANGQACLPGRVSKVVEIVGWRNLRA